MTPPLVTPDPWLMGRYEAGKTPWSTHRFGWWRTCQIWAQGRRLRGLMQRHIQSGSAVEGGPPAGAAGARRRGRPWKGGLLTGATGATVAAAGRPDAPSQPRLLCCGPHAREGHSCAVTGGESSGRCLFFSSYLVSPLVSASGDAVPKYGEAPGRTIFV